MLSLYIHIPFCKRECRYCDFYSSDKFNDRIDAFIDTVIVERTMAFEQDGLADNKIQTIFFGGGTPSILSADQWHRLCSGLFKGLVIEAGAEISMECNPDSFTPHKAEAWLAAGVNRITFGVQTLDDRLLRLLGRPHTAQQALAVLNQPVLKKFSSIGVDVMFGLPGQTMQSLNETMESLLSINRISHLSAYELTLNDHSPFGRHRRLLPLPSEENVLSMTDLVIDSCAAHGFERYEISNYCRPGYRSRHNSGYWSHAPYLGLGPSAHSYLPPFRRANVPDVNGYIDRINAGGLAVSFEEKIDEKALAGEIIMLGLRTSDGIDGEHFKQLTGKEFGSPERLMIINELITEGFLVADGNHYKSTRKGMLFADALAARF